MHRGQNALASGDAAEGLRWLDRAYRLAPADSTLALALASACLSQDPQRAVELFGCVASKHDVREAWFGLAAARMQIGDPRGATVALAQMLARHSPLRHLTGERSLADEVVLLAGESGWCGLQGDGTLLIRPAVAAAITVRLDGRRCREARLPPSWTRARQVRVSVGDKELIGSPIDVASILRTTGFVEAHDDGLRGWAWHPRDPDADPRLTIRTVSGRIVRRLTATARDAVVQLAVPLARPRGFFVPANALQNIDEPLEVVGRDGRQLLGSPLYPSAESRPNQHPPPPATGGRKKVH
ncbi:MAG: hypothetical protein JO227_22315, partial [Acetobacteraceae bacterium]|nr:hypothetical protein [Acetobacteraceae bacterium]